jgi:hypothetical protein
MIDDQVQLAEAKPHPQSVTLANARAHLEHGSGERLAV